MRLVQFWDKFGMRQVAFVAEKGLVLQIIMGFDSVYTLALAADQAHADLRSLVQANLPKLITSHRPFATALDHDHRPY